jgi:hypothetical protein
MSTTLQPDLSIMNATDTLEIRDSRTGKSYSVPITDGTIRAQDLRQIRVDDSEFGMMSYDPGEAAVEPPASLVPEPTSAVLFAMAILAAGLGRRRVA